MPAIWLHDCLGSGLGSPDGDGLRAVGREAWTVRLALGWLGQLSRGLTRHPGPAGGCPDRVAVATMVRQPSCAACLITGSPKPCPGPSRGETQDGDQTTLRRMSLSQTVGSGELLLGPAAGSGDGSADETEAESDRRRRRLGIGSC